jgi:hypothetical protein
MSRGRELRRLRDESGCRFGDRRVLSKRYLVGNLLGKGGFSDVYSVRLSSPHSACAKLIICLTLQMGTEQHAAVAAVTVPSARQLRVMQLYTFSLSFNSACCSTKLQGRIEGEHTPAVKWHLMTHRQWTWWQ